MLEVRQAVAGEGACLRLERDELDVEPAPPVGLFHLGVESRAQRGGGVDETGRRARLLRVDEGLQVGRAEVAVDEAGDVPVEAEREEEVVAGDRIWERDVPPAADRRGPGAAHRCIRLRPGRPRPVVRVIVAGRRVARLPDSGRELVNLRRDVEADAAGPVADHLRGADGPCPAPTGPCPAPTGPCPAPTPPDSPRNGIPCRSTASRLIRSAAVFWRATSRT